MADYISKGAGILPFGSGDSSIVLECAMTDSADITAQGGTLRSGATVDSIKGVSGATAGAVMFDLLGYDSLLDNAGQVSFETEGIYLTATEGATGNPTPHGGHDHYADSTLDATHWSTNTVDSNTGNPALFNTYSADNRHGFKLQSSEGDYFNTGRSVCLAKGEFCRVTLSWGGGRREVYFNGSKVFSASTVGANTGDFRYMFLASTGGSIWPVLSGQHYRNLTVSTKPVGLSAHPLLSDVCCIGDSLFQQSYDDAQKNADGSFTRKADPWRSSVSFAMEHVFAERGLSSEIDLSGAVSGEAISTEVAATISDQVSIALAKNPRIVCYRGGTNDVIQQALGNVTIAQSIIDLKAQATTILNHPTVEYLIIGTVPSLSNDPSYSASSFETVIDEINTGINSMPAWAAANGFTGRIIIADQFAAFGAHTPTFELFQTDNLHPGSYGKWAMGELYANAILKVLG